MRVRDGDFGVGECMRYKGVQLALGMVSEDRQDLGWNIAIWERFFGRPTLLLCGFKTWGLAI